jgi:hypothetical protein
MKQLIGLYGTSNVGKSQTIRFVYEKLCNENFLILEEFEQIIPTEGDICVVIIINGKLIGIESQGDPNSRIFISLPKFVKIKCDIILCATRTRGATVKEVEKLSSDYEIKWVKKEEETNVTKQKSANDNLANEIFKLIKNKIR